MPWLNVIAVGSGAAFGAWTRWGLGMWLNPLFPILPFGTLAANLLGGFLIGALMAVADPLGFPPAARLLLATGFLGGLTTFSTFSAEVMSLLLRQQIGWALLTVGVHLLGSLLMTAAGLMLARTLLLRWA
jgi:CrcB protein